MSVRWERLAGDTDRFAVRLSFAADPHGGRGVEPETAASWGGMQLWVDGVNLSAHVDGGQAVDATYWYQLPLLEWLAENWDPLTHEGRLPNPDSPSAAGVQRPWLDLVDTDGMVFHQVEEDWAWRSRHSLRFARDGGVVPGVFFRRHRGDVEVSWYDRPLEGAGEVKHLAPAGRGLVEADFFASALHEVVSAASHHLLTAHPESTRLQELADRLKTLADPSALDTRVAWLAGLGSSRDAALARWHEVRTLAEKRVGEAIKGIFEPSGNGSPLVVGGSPIAALLFSSMSPSIQEDDVLTLTKLAVQRQEVADGQMAEYTRQEPLVTGTPAWEQGYELAGDARADLGLNDDPVDMDALLQSIGIRTSDIELDDPGIRGVTLAGDGRSTLIGVNLSYPHAERVEVRRFTLAHELCHALFDEDFGVSVAIASGPWAPRELEQRANAFAAMFLMPPQLLRRTQTDLGTSVEDPDGVRAVSDKLAVSHRALIEHARNVGLIRPEAYAKLTTTYRLTGSLGE